MENIAIIGAGIGGVTAAIALSRRGLQASVYEATDACSALGTGILVPPNAMRVMEKLGLNEYICSSGRKITTLCVVDSKGNLLSENTAQFNGISTTAIHRSKLQDILLSNLDSPINYGKRLKSIGQDPQGVSVSFEDNTAVMARCAIAADGLKSRVRGIVFPSSNTRYSGQLCWRGVASYRLDDTLRDKLTEIWGHGIRFGFCQLGGNQLYWYATKVCKPDYVVEQDIKQCLLEVFSGFCKPVDEIIRNTLVSTIHTSFIYDLAPMNVWHSGNIALLGDAAHASTPNLGQGGAQAIEDAWVIAEKLATNLVCERAFSEYYLARHQKANHIINTSWQISRLTNISNPAMCFLRNFIFRCVPASIGDKQSSQIYAVDY